jgi:8-oxo-dGTP diphosphatase
MKTVKVAAAVICDSLAEKRTVFATARGYGPYRGQWEFPGGKVEPGETPEEALRREIREELETEIQVGPKIGTIEYDYPEFHLSMDCFWCEITGGELTLLEAEEARWLTKETIREMPWLPADITLIEQIREAMAPEKENNA